jgi:hypothetical protein
MKVSGQPYAPAALPPGKEPPVPTGKEGGGAPEPVCTLRTREKSLDPAGNRTAVVHPVARRYTDWATQAPPRLIVGGHMLFRLNYLHYNSQLNPSAKHHSTRHDCKAPHNLYFGTRSLQGLTLPLERSFGGLPLTKFGRGLLFTGIDVKKEPTIHENRLICLYVQNASREANRRSDSHENHQGFIIVFTSSHHLNPLLNRINPVHLHFKIYSMAQKSVNWLVKRTLKYVGNVSYYLLNLQKLLIRSSILSAQLTMLWYRCTNWLAGLYLNIPVNTRECFRLTDF